MEVTLLLSGWQIFLAILANVAAVLRSTFPAIYWKAEAD
jgi:hypothetical protein